MGPPPVVTGLSPKDGPPGTRITIRGEFLGIKANDLIGLTICGSDCLLSAEWKSKNKIVARSGPGKGRGDIIVTTKSGGRGTCTVEFRAYHEPYGPMKESAVWVEEGSAPMSWAHVAWSIRSRPLSPKSYAPPDPLGLSTEENENNFPNEELVDLFPDCSGDLSAENFHPGWFLLEHHHGTTFDDLKAGTLYLKRKVDVQKEGQLNFLKANTGSVMDQLDALILLKDRFELDLREGGKEPLKKLEKAIDESMTEANKLFDDVLARKDNADTTRTALAILTRHKFLFQLPGNIDKNISKEDYDLVINDYARAKNLFGKTEVPIFKKVLAEVELRIENLRKLLHERLQRMPIGVDEQKHLIRSLMNLEWKGDAAWDGIVSRCDFINKEIARTRDHHIQLEQSEDEQAKIQKSNKSSVSVANSDTWPARVLLCGSLCPLLSEDMPDLWRLGQSYFCGELRGDGQLDKSEKFKRMILATIETFSRTLRGAILPQTLDRSGMAEKLSWGNHPMPNLCNWLAHCLRDVRETYGALMRLDLPSDALDIVGNLIFDLRLHCMIGLLKQATDKVKSFHKLESWKVEFDPQHGGITELPALLEKTIYEVMNVIKESVVVSCPREKPLLENASSACHHLSTHIQEMLLVYTKCLETLAFKHDEHDIGQSPISVVLGAPELMATGLNNSNAGLGSGDTDSHSTTPLWQHRLLITLSNCQYTNKCVLARILSFFEKNGFPKLLLAAETAKSSLRTLDKSIMEAYLEQKSDPLVGTIEPSMYIGKFDWDMKYKPTDVRPYAKECINNLIAVHAEVHSISPSLVKTVLTQIIETVAQELSRLMSTCRNSFSQYGALQAHIDLTVLKDILTPLTTQRAKNYFEEALECIPKIKAPEENMLEKQIISDFHTRTKLQTICFKNC